MDNAIVEGLFHCVNQKTHFICSKDRDDPITFAIETDVQLLGHSHAISISSTTFTSINQMALFMHISEGFGGKRAYLVSELLLRLNTIISVGSFGNWHDNGDIVFKKNIDTRRLSCGALIRHLESCVKVYIATKPKLMLFAGNWGLTPLTSSELQAITRELSWEFQGIERDLLM